MMREEFEQLTGIEVSFYYYTQEIEPLYMSGDVEKQIFCAEWKKSHKAELITCLGKDFHRLGQRLLANEASFSQERRLLTERENVLNEKVSMQSLRIVALEKQVEELERMLDDNDKIIEKKEQQIEDIKFWSKEDHTHELKAKDHEIMTLKAKLYDMMCGIPYSA